MIPAGAAQGPLRGIRVIDLTVNVLGPTCTQILGDMGADVIKIETPEGDPNRHNGPARNPGMTAMFLTFNRNKRSVALNLKEPRALEALMRLVETADVFVHSMRPSAAQRLGVGYEAICARNPRIIYANGPGYSRGTAREDEPMYDDVVQGASGIADLMGRFSGEARYFPTVVADKFCGYVLSSAIAMALFDRERTGAGQQVQVPMFETMIQFNLLEHLFGAVFDPIAPPGTGYPRLMTDHRRPYRTMDGYVCLMAVSDDQWLRLLNAIGRADLLEDERFKSHTTRSENIDDLYAVLTAQMALRTTQEWLAILTVADIPNGPVRSFEELFEDSYLNDTGFFSVVDHPTEGALRMVANPMQFSRGSAALMRHAPMLGEHNREILEKLGYAANEIDDIVGSRV